MTRRPVTVVEVEPFPTRARLVWSDEERMVFVTFIAHHPEAGDLIPGSGGLRKIRWIRQGTGKRGGVRVIYYFHNDLIPYFSSLSTRKTAARIYPNPSFRPSAA